MQMRRNLVECTFMIADGRRERVEIARIEDVLDTVNFKISFHILHTVTSEVGRIHHFINLQYTIHYTEWKYNQL